MALTNAYCTLAELKSTLRITDNVDDSILEIAINSASRAIDSYCERQFFQSAPNTQRVYTPEDSFVTQIDDLTTLVSIQTSSDGEGFDTTWKASDYQLEPLNGVAGGISSSYTRIRAIGDFLFPTWAINNVNSGEATVRITGTFGWSAIPVEIKQACLLQSARAYKRYDSPLGVAGFGELGVIRVAQVDPDVKMLLQPYAKVRMA
jgi:hypothetical protein